MKIRMLLCLSAMLASCGDPEHPIQGAHESVGSIPSGLRARASAAYTPREGWITQLRERADVPALSDRRRKRLEQLWSGSDTEVQIAVTPGSGAVARLFGSYPTRERDPELATSAFLEQYASELGMEPDRLTSRDPMR